MYHLSALVGIPIFIAAFVADFDSNFTRVEATIVDHYQIVFTTKRLVVEQGLSLAALGCLQPETDTALIATADLFIEIL